MQSRPLTRAEMRICFCAYIKKTRPKKSLITSHIQSHHQDEAEAAMAQGVEVKEGAKANNTCEECGATFKKPAYLRQHMQGHSLERPFKCSIEDCPTSYRRKDHLAHHFLQHKGKIFSCPVEGCNKSFAYQWNMKRHVSEIHNDALPSTPGEFKSLKQHVGPEVGRGKVFKFASQLQNHEDSHGKSLIYEGVLCMKYFSNVDYLKEHVRSAHQLINCDICGTKQLRKNIQQHLRTHEKKNPADSEAFRCVEGCLHIFSIHLKAIHLEVRPFKFWLLWVQGDYEELDEKFRSRARGGRKRKCLTIESLLQKRVTLPGWVEKC
ncbi:hypothetical protein EUGRSUZ_A00580 [Eucalyptus grandis]|uniref:Uncharacterized protein n=2 Tax=Eucalyptus grandis TaxID=71139 RepID=A0ACC3M1B0_EUCGR|nr:hypothetical protein EUGRSUZ_A00580 [Eucalyptus grandis]